MSALDARGLFSTARARVRLLWSILEDRPEVWNALLGVGLLVALIVSTTIGAVSIPLGELPSAIASTSHPLHAVIWEVRIPRIAVGALVGASLAVAGALMQTVVRNPLADPALIGVSAGAAVAALLAIVLFPEMTLLMPALAFAGGLTAAGVVLLAAWNGPQSAGTLRIVLSGVAIQAMLFAGIALITFLFADRAPAFVAFTVGSLHGSGWREAGIVGVTALIGIAISLLSLRTLDVLLLDDDSAGGVGLGVRGARVLAACLSALLASGAVCVAGLVGFVGLVAPNALRLVVGPSHGRLLPISAAGGALLVVVADAIARSVAAPLELPVGAFLALIGGPYFLVLLWRRLT